MRIIRWATVICGALIVTGCTNYAAVQTLSEQAVSAAGTWNGVARQSTVACRRFIALGDGSGDCVTEQRGADGLIAANDLLARYFTALGSVATDRNYSVSAGMTDLSGAVSQIPGFNADDATAVDGLGAAIANVALQGKRERTMRRLIEQGAPPAERVIATMRRVAVSVFSGNLDAEAVRLDQALGDAVPDPLTRLGPDRAAWCTTPPRLNAFGKDHAAFLMALELCRRYRPVRDERAAIAAYDASLVKAAEALQALQSSKTRLGAAETAHLLYDTAQQLRDKVAAVRAARNGGEAR